MEHGPVLGALTLLTVCSVQLTLAQEDQLATADSSRIETVVSPDALAKLLATATGSIAAGVSAPLVLAPKSSKFRNKRKQISRLKAHRGSKFVSRPTTEAPDSSEENPFVTSQPQTKAPRKKFTGFPKRSRPIIQKTRFKLRPGLDHVQEVNPTPLPVVDLIPQPTARAPVVLTNEIETEDVEKKKEALFEQLRSQASLITGAQPVGVSRNIRPVPSQEKAKTLEPTPTTTTSLATKASVREERSNRREHGRQLRLGSSVARRRDSDSANVGQRRQEDIYVDDSEVYEEYEYEEDDREEGPKRVVDLPRRRKNPQQLVNRNAASRTKIVKLGGRASNVENIENYRYQNEDGSITWGYQNEDGSFKEETIGIDCITHGKYGYVDPDGEVREYSYTSGNRCDPDTRKVESISDGNRATKHGYFDHARNNFVMPNGRRVKVVVNQGNKARGRRY